MSDNTSDNISDPVGGPVDSTVDSTVDSEVGGDGEETTTPAKVGLVTRMKTSADSMKVKAEGVRDDLEKRRETNRFIDIAFGSAEYETTAGGGILAGAVAFRFFLFIVPYVFFMVIVFGLGADAAGQDPVELAKKSGIAGLAASAIKDTSTASWFTRIATFVLVVWALVSGSRTLVKSVRAVYAIIWRVPFDKLRGTTTKGIIAIGIITGVLIVAQLEALLKEQSVLLWVVALALEVGVPTGLWLLCTVKVLPSAPGTTWRDLWPGALLFGVGVQMLHVVTVVWIARSLESKSERYGALGVALTILFWAYLLGRLVTASASLSAVLWADKQNAVGTEETAPFSESGIDPTQIDPADIEPTGVPLTEGDTSEEVAVVESVFAPPSEPRPAAPPVP